MVTCRWNGCTGPGQSRILVCSAAQRHANIKTRSELVQLAHVNAFHCTCAFKRTHSLFMVSVFTTRSYCYSCYLPRLTLQDKRVSNEFETRS